MNTDSNVNSASALVLASAIPENILAALSSDKKKELLEAERRIAIQALPMVNSKDLIGEPLNILDAIHSTIDEEVKQNGVIEVVTKPVVVFVMQIQKTGEVCQVTKGSNTFNDSYVARFDAWRDVADNPMLDFVFVEDARWSHAGNNAVVLRKIQPEQPKEKTVAK